MKLAFRIFALSIVIAGAAAASVSSSTTSSKTHFRSHQSPTETLPLPTCGPRMPGCPQTGSGQ